jgi:hypothetical protein
MHPDPLQLGIKTGRPHVVTEIPPQPRHPNAASPPPSIVHRSGQPRSESEAAARPAPDAIHRSHSRFAFRFAARAHGRLLYVPGLSWHRWDGHRWIEDQGDAVALRSVVDTVADAWIEVRTHPGREQTQRAAPRRPPM